MDNKSVITLSPGCPVVGRQMCPWIVIRVRQGRVLDAVAVPFSLFFFFLLFFLLAFLDLLLRRFLLLFQSLQSLITFLKVNLLPFFILFFFLRGGGKDRSHFRTVSKLNSKKEIIQTSSNKCDRMQRIIEVDCKCMLIFAEYNKFKY
jgi:hypothetical protein